ncbi:MAG: alginate O-acetyltransferase [Lachnospiraceae bacterium]|nr:alginate O-acetyltransferase [Lachnospiraceae bacterium]
MKKWMIGCFWGLLVLPNLIWPLASRYLEEENTENRVMARFPSVSRENLSAYPSEVESYINDHAAFRSQFLSLNAGINLGLFRSVDNPEVIRGKDGWYFYNGGASTADYRGQNLYSQEELAAIAAKIEETRLHFENQGIEFAVILAPNKEEIYSEYMPEAYTRLSECTRYDQMEQVIREQTQAKLVAPKDYFLENRERLWYFKTDTHWNEAGGFVAGQMLVEELGGDGVSVDEVVIPYDYRGPGDLALLFHMPEHFLEDYFCTVNGYYDEVAVETTDPVGDGMVIRTSAPDAPDKRRVAFYRDSFATVMMNKISKYFQNIDYYHWQGFEPRYLEENPPDVVVYEVVEREFERILSDMDKLTLAFSETPYYTEQVQTP